MCICDWRIEAFVYCDTASEDHKQTKIGVIKYKDVIQKAGRLLMLACRSFDCYSSRLWFNLYSFSHTLLVGETVVVFSFYFLAILLITINISVESPKALLVISFSLKFLISML